MCSAAVRTMSACFFIGDGATGCNKTHQKDKVTLAGICIHINLILNCKGCNTDEETLVKGPNKNASLAPYVSSSLFFLTVFDYSTWHVTSQFTEMNFSLINFFH